MLNMSLLKPGDILLFRETKHSALYDKMIAVFQKLLYKVPQNAKYFHVSMVDWDTTQMLEAVWPKTHSTAIDPNSDTAIIEVYRVKGITVAEIDEALTWGHQHLGEWYDIPLFLTGWISFKHTQICSTFVTNMLKNAKLHIPHIPSDQKIILPDNYADDNQLERMQ